MIFHFTGPPDPGCSRITQERTAWFKFSVRGFLIETRTKKIFRLDENNFLLKTLMNAKRIHVSHHPNAETLMAVMNANAHLVSSKKMAFVWMSTNASKFFAT